MRGKCDAGWCLPGFSCYSFSFVFFKFFFFVFIAVMWQRSRTCNNAYIHSKKFGHPQAHNRCGGSETILNALAYNVAGRKLRKTILIAHASGSCLAFVGGWGFCVNGVVRCVVWLLWAVGGGRWAVCVCWWINGWSSGWGHVYITQTSPSTRVQIYNIFWRILNKFISSVRREIISHHNQLNFRFGVCISKQMPCSHKTQECSKKKKKLIFKNIHIYIKYTSFFIFARLSVPTTFWLCWKFWLALMWRST